MRSRTIPKTTRPCPHGHHSANTQLPRRRFQRWAASLVMLGLAVLCGPSTAGANDIDISRGIKLVPPSPPGNQFEDLGDDGSGHLQPTFTNSPGLARGQNLAASIKVTELPEGWVPPPPDMGPRAGQGGSAAGADYRNGPEHVNDAYCVSKGEALAPQLPFQAHTSRLPLPQGSERASSAADAAQTDGNTAKTDPVNPFNGELVVSQNDLEFPGFGVPFVLNRTYRSRVDFADSAIGAGWALSLDRRVVSDPGGPCGGVTYSAGDGTSMRFLQQATIFTPVSSGITRFNISYGGPKGVRASLRATGLDTIIGGLHVMDFQWTMTTPDGISATFDRRGVMTRLEDLNHRGLTLTWEETSTGDGYKVTKVVDSVGREIQFSYYPNDHLKRVWHEQSGLEAKYSYDDNDLTAATSSDGRTEHYIYDHGHPDETGDYIPEGQLRAGCERVCGPAGSSCEATGVCDNVAAAAKSQCHQSCGQCVNECPQACFDYCMSPAGDGARACAQPGPNGEPSCAQACGANCEAHEEAVCDSLWTGRKLIEGDQTISDPTGSVERECHECRDGCTDACGYECNGISECLAGAGAAAALGAAGAGTNGAALAGSAALVACAEEYGIDETLGSLGDWGEVGAYAAIDLVSCGLHHVCSWLGFGISCGDCDWDNVKDAFFNACDNSCRECCADGNNCAQDSCQRGHTCEGDCREAFYGRPVPPATDENGNVHECEGILGGGRVSGCQEKFGNECNRYCQNQCLGKCGYDCDVACMPSCVTACGVSDGSCAAECETLDYVGLCREGCVAGCMEKGRGHDDRQRYGYVRDLNHNLTAILDSNFVPYLLNTYGLDPNSPSFDAVVTQTTGGRLVEFEYRDLMGETELGQVSRSLKFPTLVRSQNNYQSVDICPTLCDEPPRVGDGEWVPWPGGLVLVKAPATVGGVGSVSNVSTTASVPPTTLRLVDGGKRYESVTGAAGIPAGLGFKLNLAGGPVTFTARPDGASWELSGALSLVAAYRELSILRDTAGVLRVYEGRPLGLAHLVEGSCSAPFRATRNDAGQLQILPDRACAGPLSVSPLATMVTDTSLLGAFSNGDLAALTAANTFVSSAMVPGRYVTSWTPVAGLPGRYEATLGPQEGGAPTTLTKAAFDAIHAAPLLRAPTPARLLADGRPLYAFHVPVRLRPLDPGRVFPIVWDSADEYTIWTDEDAECVRTGMPFPPRREVGSRSRRTLPTAATVVKDPYGATWTFYYDKQGNTLREVNHGTGAERSYNYDSTGDLVAVEQPLRGRTCLRYDTSGNIVTSLQFPAAGAVGDTLPIRQRFTYKASPSRPEGIFDPRDPTKALATYRWDDRGRILSITDATNATTTFVPTEFGLPGEVHAPDGSVERIEYDESAGLPHVVTKDATGPSPIVQTLEYDSAGRLEDSIGPLGERLHWTWQNGTLLSTLQNDDGVTSSTQFTVDDGRIRTTSHGPRLTEVTYDSIGLPRKMRVTAADGSAPPRVACTKYGPGGRLLEEIRPNGSRMQYSYDTEGRLTSVVAGAWPRVADDGLDPECAVATPAAGEFRSGLLSTTVYDLDGRPTVVVDATGERSNFTWDGFGRLAMVTDSRGASHRVGYDAMGNVVWSSSYSRATAQTSYHAPLWAEAGGSLVAASTSTYDELGRLRSQDVWQFDAAGHRIGTGDSVTTYAYRRNPNQVTVTDPTGAQTIQTFDGAGRPSLMQYGTSDTEAFTYLDGGRTVLREWSAPTSDGMLSELTHLTDWGAPLRVETNETGSLKVKAGWSYDSDRRPIGAVNAGGSSQTFGYDAFDQVHTIQSQVDGTTTAQAVFYDTMGRVRDSTSDASNGRGAVNTHFTYDVLGRPRTAIFPGGRTEDYAYELASNRLTTKHDARGVAFTYAYTGDLLDSITATAPNDPASKQQITYVRDSLGRPTSGTHSGTSFTASTDDITTSISYDSMGNKLGEYNSRLGATLGVTHVPDARGQPRHSTFGGLSVDRVFDPIGRLTDVRLAGESAPAVHFAYDGLGGATQRTLSSGVTTTYAYDALGRIKSQTDMRGATSLAAWRWEQGIDGVPRVAGLRKNGGAEVSSIYQVDAASRVITERNALPDVSGVTLAPDATPAQSNATVAPWTNVGAVKYLYDGRSNWKQRIAGLATLNVQPVIDDKDAYTRFGSITPTYDANGALTTMGDETYTYDALGNLTSAQKGPIQKRFYEYDAFGRRVVQREAATGAVFLFGFDGPARVIRKTPTNQVDITVDGDLDEHLVRVVQGGARQFYHQDRQHSVYLVSDSSGQPLEWYSYSAFGEMSLAAPDGTARFASAIDNRFGYQGQPLDVQLGLVDMRARMYRPAWGRFISPDPIGYAGGANLYSFVGSATLSSWDPFGLREAALRWSSQYANMVRKLMADMSWAADSDWSYSSQMRYMADSLIHGGPGNAWSGIKAVPEGFWHGATALGHALAHPVLTVQGLLQTDKAILNFINDPITGMNVVRDALDQYARTHDEQQVATGVGHLLGGAEFGLVTGGVAAAGFARASVLVRGLIGGETAAASTGGVGAGTTAAATNAAEATDVLEEGQTWLYRGLHAKHPAMAEALEGRVEPGNPEGVVTPETHNLGGYSADSPYTSWTRDYDVALEYAKSEGPGGIVIRVPTGAPPLGATWSWAWSPDVYHEAEVLLKGIREGAKVIFR